MKHRHFKKRNEDEEKREGRREMAHPFTGDCFDSELIASSGYDRLHL